MLCCLVQFCLGLLIVYPLYTLRPFLVWVLGWGEILKVRGLWLIQASRTRKLKQYQVMAVVLIILHIQTKFVQTTNQSRMLCFPYRCLWRGNLNNRPHLVKWKLCCANKRRELGIKNLVILNSASLAKWVGIFLMTIKTVESCHL